MEADWEGGHVRWLVKLYSLFGRMEIQEYCEKKNHVAEICARNTEISKEIRLSPPLPYPSLCITNFMFDSLPRVTPDPYSPTFPLMPSLPSLPQKNFPF
jgi:hypothetical protein